ncbi:MAG: alpha-D-ribose 1-methylphosphonate 5-triphosphate synthase subunit PhnG [Candidatus Endobugula sp.]
MINENSQKDDLQPAKKRQQLLSVLSVSELSAIQSYWQALSISPRYSLLKAPEVGMTMVRAKTGGTGQAFNMGEMTVTRTVIRLNDINAQNDVIGFGYTAGRNTQKSELIAVIDACFQLSEYAASITKLLLQPLQQLRQQQKNQQTAQVNATKVNFFTMVRGE